MLTHSSHDKHRDHCVIHQSVKEGVWKASEDIFPDYPNQIQELFRFPICWEHTMWRGKSHKLISSTLNVLIWTVLIMILISVSFGVILVNTIFRIVFERFSNFEIWIILGIIYILFIFSWIGIFRSISRKIKYVNKERESISNILLSHS